MLKRLFKFNNIFKAKTIPIETIPEMRPITIDKETIYVQKSKIISIPTTQGLVRITETTNGDLVQLEPTNTKLVGAITSSSETAAQKLENEATDKLTKKFQFVNSGFDVASKLIKGGVVIGTIVALNTSNTDNTNRKKSIDSTSSNSRSESCDDEID